MSIVYKEIYMIYNLGQMNNTKEFAGSAYYGANKIRVYRQKGLLRVYGGNDILMAKYPANSFTVMEAMYLTIAGCFYVENADNIRKDILDRLDDIYLTKVDIPENSQWECKLKGEYYDL